MRQSFLLLCFLILGSIALQAQDFAMQNGTINRCNGEFTDDGVGGPYLDNPYTLTICPDTPGDVVQLTFTAFNLQTSPGNGNSDYLSFFDGDNTSATSLGSYTGAISNLTVTASIFNATGCLTLVFDPNGPANAGSPGWSATVSCTTPCANPTLQSAITNPLPTGTEQSVGVCIDEPVSFSGQGSAAAAGFTIADYVWDFADGTTGNGMNVTHSFSEPGEYVVNLTVYDNNGCTNVNVIPLQVLVSTIPIFAGVQMIETEYCLGADLILDAGEIISTTWTALPPQVVSGTTYLADGAGFSYSSSITYDFFEAGQTLENCDDLYGVLVNMEHSYMGDLGITITCPNGTVVDLISFGTNGGGGTFLGEAVDDNGTDNLMAGTGYDYLWAPNATNGTWGQNTQDLDPTTYTNNLGQVVSANILPAGTYESEGNLCDLVGCPLNGAWTFSVYDNLGADNGYIFEWGLSLNPQLYPGVTTFTPNYGPDSDSTWWEGPNIGAVSDNGDVITLNITQPGSYDYTYYATNNFGCTFDTTITVVVEIAPSVTAGPDMIYACGELQLQGSFVGMPPPLCSDESGTYTYCYSDSENALFTYCPNNPGDGTMMTLTFNAGSTEACCDFIYIYDGSDTNAPLIAGPIGGDLTGLQFTATNADGCLTMRFTSDFSVNCANGFGNVTEWNYTVGCTAGGPPYTWHWDPGTGLDDNNVQNPLVTQLNQTTTYQLTGYPIGFPGCATTDEVVITVDPLSNPGVDTQIAICNTDMPFLMTDRLNGNPVPTGVWYDAFGTQIADGMFDPAMDMAGNYQYVVSTGTCDLSAILTIDMAGPTQISLSNDTVVCTAGTVNLNLESLFFGLAPFQYTWTYNGELIGSSEDLVYQPADTGVAVLTVTDACMYVVQDSLTVTVLPSINVVFSADTTGNCWPAAFNLVNEVDPTYYTESHWQIGDGMEYFNVPTINHLFENPGTYDVQLTLTNAVGCSYTATYGGYLSSYPPPVASFEFSPQPTDASQTEITFENLSTGQIQSNVWTFGQNPQLGVSAQANPVFEFPLGVGGEYPVELTVTTIHNCTDDHEGIVIINDIFNVFVPTAFTPNSDGINDFFFIQGSDIDVSRFHFQVFDRWGNQVFETRDINTPWKGDVDFGDHYAPNGAYNWRSVFISKSTGERKELNGSIVIFR